MTAAPLPTLRGVPAPEHDPGPRAGDPLSLLARRIRPHVSAHERRLTLSEVCAPLAPDGLTRGSVVVLNGAPGSGVTSLALEFARAATAAGEWVAVMDSDGSLGGLALAVAGVATGAGAVIRGVGPAGWASTLAVLLDGVGAVMAVVPPHVRAADARRLVARARERRTLLTLLAWDHGRGAADWPAEATLRCTVTGTRWRGLESGGGRLERCDLRVMVDGRGAAGRATSRVLHVPATAR